MTDASIMRTIRGKPAVGKPRKIICTGCDKRAAEAGIAVKEEAVETGWAAGPGFDGPVTMIDDEDAYPLCEDCVTALERGEVQS
jgi:hypothetical protein